MSPRKAKPKGPVARAAAVAAEAEGARAALITGDFFGPELAKLHPVPPKGHDSLHDGSGFD